MPAGFLALIGFLLILILTPVILMEVMIVAFYKLGIHPLAGLVIVISIFLGSIVNIPIKRNAIKQRIDALPAELFGLNFGFPRKTFQQTEQIIAVNLGGCIIPMMVVIYELARLFGQGAFLAPLIAILLNITACYSLSRSIPGAGIVLPAIIPGVLAALCGLLLYPENSPAVAFCAGVLGPVVGADLLKLRKFSAAGGNFISIGGAGTFDGIVISGILALLLS